MALLRPVVAWNDAELWVRLPSVVAAVVAAIAAYRLGRRLAGRHAGAAAWAHPRLVARRRAALTDGRTTRPRARRDAPLQRALRPRRRARRTVPWWAVYAVSAVLLPLTHPIAASALLARSRQSSWRAARSSSGWPCRPSRSPRWSPSSPHRLRDRPRGCRQRRRAASRSTRWARRRPRARVDPVVAALALWGVVVSYGDPATPARVPGDRCSWPGWR